jgi:hypothetical protein
LAAGAANGHNLLPINGIFASLLGIAPDPPVALIISQSNMDSRELLSLGSEDAESFARIGGHFRCAGLDISSDHRQLPGNFLNALAIDLH